MKAISALPSDKLGGSVLAVDGMPLQVFSWSQLPRLPFKKQNVRGRWTYSPVVAINSLAPMRSDYKV